MKKCSKCCETKELTEFYKQGGRCKKCICGYTREWQIKNADKDKQTKKVYRENNKEYMLNKALEWNKANPEKFRTNLKKYQYNTSGVYQILNNQDQCLYVGQTIRFNGRKSAHKTFAKNPSADKQHPSLYKNLNKEGEIKIQLIEECSKEILLEREKYWINKLKPKYNA